MKTKRSPWAQVALYLFVFVICMIILYPCFVMLTTAAKSNEEMYATGEAAVLLPSVWQWSNFIDIWREAPVFKYLLNSIIVAGGATCLAILCGIPAAYALSRMRYKGKGIFMGAVIMSQMFSPMVLLVGINVFYGFNIIKWQYLFATSIFATIPVVVLFLCIEKHLVAGLTSGGVKG